MASVSLTMRNTDQMTIRKTHPTLLFSFLDGIVRSAEFIISDSQTVLPGEVNSASGDVASTMALASFCSNSINESAIAQENSTK